MKFVKVIDNLENATRREMSDEIAAYHNNTGEDYYKILSQIEDYNFIVDRGYFYKLKTLIKQKFNEQITGSAGGFVLDENHCAPAISISTKNQTIVLTMYTAYNVETDEMGENRQLSIDWLTILKQKFGIGYVKKLTQIAQCKKYEQIKQAEQDYNNFMSKLIDAELNFQNKL